MDPLLGVVSGTKADVSERKGISAAPKSILLGEHYTMLQVSVAENGQLSHLTPINRRESRTATCLEWEASPKSASQPCCRVLAEWLIYHIVQPTCSPSRLQSCEQIN